MFHSAHMLRFRLPTYNDGWLRMLQVVGKMAKIPSIIPDTGKEFPYFRANTRPLAHWRICHQLDWSEVYGFFDFAEKPIYPTKEAILYCGNPLRGTYSVVKNNPNASG
jgi:hypothetical protein